MAKRKAPWMFDPVRVHKLADAKRLSPKESADATRQLQDMRVRLARPHSTFTEGELQRLRQTAERILANDRIEKSVHAEARQLLASLNGKQKK